MSKSKIESFKVTKEFELPASEEITVESKEGLWFYHGWLRTELELVEIAHNMLVEFADTGNCNYRQTREYKEIESILKQVNYDGTMDGKVRLNCQLTGKFEWVHPQDLYQYYSGLIDILGDYLTDVYGLEDYSVYYFEGDWGLWPNWED